MIILEALTSHEDSGIPMKSVALDVSILDYMLYRTREIYLSV